MKRHHTNFSQIGLWSVDKDWKGVWRELAEWLKSHNLEEEILHENEVLGIAFISVVFILDMTEGSALPLDWKYGGSL